MTSMCRKRSCPDDAQGRFNTDSARGFAVEAISTLTERRCACIRCPGLPCFSSDNLILWFAILYHESFLCLLDLAKKHISSPSVLSGPCLQLPAALPYLWADIPPWPWPWPWPVAIWGAHCLGLGLGLPPAALLLPGAAGRAWPVRPCPASWLPRWAPAACPWGSSRPALCPGSACGNTAVSSSSVTRRRRAVYRYGAHSPFFCVTGTRAASSAPTGHLCGWPRAGRTFTAWAVKGLACHSF